MLSPLGSGGVHLLDKHLQKLLLKEMPHLLSYYGRKDVFYTK
jgi:hypothetical protein